MENKKIEDRKYKLELEIIELREEYQPRRMTTIAKKSLQKMILNKIDGKMGEC